MADKPIQLGRLAVERGFISEEQLSEALQEFNVRKAAGGQVPLGQMLVELELLTRIQLEGLLKAQGAANRARQPIPGYELIKKLGEGGMGATYLARQSSLDRLVALKVLKRKLAGNADFVARFQREARLSGQLSHPNIVGVHDVGEGGGFRYLAMEYVEGRCLQDLIPVRGGMDEQEALRLVVQVARALEHAHRHGVVHRDVKPENVLVTGSGGAKLCDFGLARDTEGESRLTQTGTMMGSPHYVSPEQARGDRDADIRSDIYSLGVTLFHMVTGETPFDGATPAVIMTRHINDRVPWAAELNPEVSENVCRLIEKMTARDREERYRTPAELLADLELVLDGQAPASAASAPRRTACGDGARGGARRRGARRAFRRAVPAAEREPVADAEEPEAEAAAGEEERDPTGYLESVGTVGRLLEPVGARRRLPWPILVAAGGVLVVLALLAVVLAVRGGRGVDGGDDVPGPVARVEPEDGLGQTPAPAPPDAPVADEKDRQAQEMYELAEALWKRNPEDYAGAVARFEKVRAGCAGSKWELLADEAIGQVRAARLRAAEAVLATLAARAGKLAAAGDYDGALAVFGDPPATFADLLGPKFEAERKELRTAVEERLGAALAEAERCSAAGEPDKGLAQIEKVRAVRYAALAPRLEEMRARLETEKGDAAEVERKRRLAETLRRRDAVLDVFDARILTGRWGDAREHAAAARAAFPAELLLPEVAAQLAAAEAAAGQLAAHEAVRAAALPKLAGAAVGSLRGRDTVYENCRIVRVGRDAFDVEYDARLLGEKRRAGVQVPFSTLADGEFDRLLPAFEPKGADGQIARLLLAAARRNLAEAGRALAAAGTHPLAERYRGRLKKLEGEEADRAAGRAWDAGVAPLVRDRPSPEEAGKLKAALDGWTAAHGGTGFAAARKAEADRLRVLADRGIEEGLLGADRWPRQFAWRTPTGRRLAVAGFGGSDATEAAVEAALAWLARHQAADGSWDIARYEARTGTNARCRAGCTAFALLAFLGAGHADRSAKYGDNVARAVAWLVKLQRPNGRLSEAVGQGSASSAGYNHAIAGLALAEAYAMSRSPAAGKAAQLAADYSVRVHQAPRSGWRYDPREAADTSVTAWFVAQLKAARVAGLRVDDAGFQGALAFLDRVTDRDGRARYTPDGSPRPSMTAAAMASRQMLGTPADDPLMLKAADYLLRYRPVWPVAGKEKIEGGDAGFYYWHSAAAALFETGGERWASWNRAMKPVLVENQSKGGPLDGSALDKAGSWPPAAWIDGYGGRVYTAALGALVLETYYRHVPAAYEGRDPPLHPPPSPHAAPPPPGPAGPGGP